MVFSDTYYLLGGCLAFILAISAFVSMMGNWCDKSTTLKNAREEGDKNEN